MFLIRRWACLADEFEMKLSLIRLQEGLYGKAKFKTVETNHQDLTGIEVLAELPLTRNWFLKLIKNKLSGKKNHAEKVMANPLRDD